MILIFSGYDAPGDWISYNGMIRFFLIFYEEIYIETCYHFIKDLFHDEKRIKFLFEGFKYNPVKIYDEISVHVFEKRKKKYDFTRHFFNLENKIGKFLNVNCKDIDIYPSIDKEYPQRLLNEYSVFENNSTAFYLAMGLPKDIKLNYFYFDRMKDKEEHLYDRLNLQDKKYIAVCLSKNTLIQLEKIDNKDNLPIINIDYISNLWDILKVIESAEECHLIENSISLFTYHLQYKNLIKTKKVYLHAYARSEPTRIVNKETSNMFFDMLLQPKLDNWEIIY